MGSLLLARAQAAIMARERDPSDRRPFHIVIDEAQNFGSGVITTLLTDARKFAASVTVATQFLDRLENEARQAVLGSTETLVCFRLGPDDAEQLAPLFDREHQQFNPHVLYNLELGEAFCRELVPVPRSKSADVSGRRERATPEPAALRRPRDDGRARGRAHLSAQEMYDRFATVPHHRARRCDPASDRTISLSHRLTWCSASSAAPSVACATDCVCLRRTHTSFDLQSVVTAAMSPLVSPTKEHGCWPTMPTHINHRLDWAAKNDRTDHFLAHTLAVAETMLHFDCATRDGVAPPRRSSRAAAGHAGANAQRTQSILSARNDPTPREKSTDPRRARPLVRARISRRHDSQLRPRARPRHHGHLGQPARRQVEHPPQADRLLSCDATQKRFAEVWGFKSFRVLTVTTSDSRIDNMLEAQRRVAPQCPPGFFLVLDAGAHRTTRCARAGVGHEQERQRLVAPRQGCQSRSSSNANVRQ